MANTPKSIYYDFMLLSPGVHAARIESLFKMGMYKMGKVCKGNIQNDTYYTFRESNREPEVGLYIVVYGSLDRVYYLTPEEFEQEYVSLQDMCI